MKSDQTCGDTSLLRRASTAFKELCVSIRNAIHTNDRKEQYCEMMYLVWMELFITPNGVFTQDWAPSSEADVSVRRAFSLKAHVGKRLPACSSNESALRRH